MNKSTYKALLRIKRLGKRSSVASVPVAIIDSGYAKQELIGVDGERNAVYSNYVVLTESGEDYLDAYAHTMRADIKATIALVISFAALIASLLPTLFPLLQGLLKSSCR